MREESKIKDIHIHKYSDYKTTEWSGGLTREIAIYPAGANYADRDFLWRISTATVDLEKSEFTKLPDYNRILMILSGELELVHNAAKPIHLPTFGKNEFDGAWDTVSYGKVTDFNVMTRKGKCKGWANHYNLRGNQTLQTREDTDTVVILAVTGEADISIADENYKLGKMDSLIIEKSGLIDIEFNAIDTDIIIAVIGNNK